MNHDTNVHTAKRFWLCASSFLGLRDVHAFSGPVARCMSKTKCEKGLCKVVNHPTLPSLASLGLGKITSECLVQMLYI